MLYRANLISHRGTLQVVNTLHFVSHDDFWNQTALASTETPTAVADELKTHLSTVYRNLLADPYTFDRITVTQVPNPNDPEQVPVAGETSVNLAGNRSVSDSDLPPQICGVLSLRTGFAGRSFRGRMFLPPVEGKSSIVADVIQSISAYSVAVAAFAARLAETWGGGSTWSTLWQDTWHMRACVYSPTRHKQGFEPFYSPVTSTRYDGSVHWLRSRRT